MTKICLKITYLKFHWNLSGANELKMQLFLTQNYLFQLSPPTVVAPYKPTNKLIVLEPFQIYFQKMISSTVKDSIIIVTWYGC